MNDVITLYDSRAWYPLVGAVVTLLLAGWKRFGPDRLVGILPSRWQWVPAVTIPALGAFADAQSSGESWSAAVGMMAYAAVSAGMAAVGIHHTLKRVVNP